MKKIILLLMVFIVSIINAQDKIYVHITTAANSDGNVTYINHPDLNGNPNAGIVYSHVWNPNGNSGIYNNNITGLWYSNVENKWAIFNEDLSPIKEDSQYFIYIAADPSQVITHISTAANQGTDGTYTTNIDDPSFNNSDPGPYAIISNYWNPNSVYNTHLYSFYYDSANSKRGFYNRDFGPIPDGAAFKILVNGSGVSRYTHTTSAANNSGNWTVIDHPDLNGNPNATFVFSHYWGLNGNTGPVGNTKLGAWYNGTNWAIYLEDNSLTMDEGISFDIIIAPQEILGNNDITTESNIVMYPNPATNKTTISSSNEISNIRVFNILGQEVQTFSSNGTTMDLDVSSLQSGTYFVKIETELGTDTLKLIKQ